MRCFIPMASLTYYENSTSTIDVSWTKQYLITWHESENFNDLWKAINHTITSKHSHEHSENDESNILIPQWIMIIDVYTWLLASDIVDVFDFVKHLMMGEEDTDLLSKTLQKAVSYAMEELKGENFTVMSQIWDLLNRYTVFMQILLKKTESRKLTIDVFACNLISLQLMGSVLNLLVEKGDKFELSLHHPEMNLSQLSNNIEGMTKLLWRTQTLHQDEITHFLNSKLRKYLVKLFEDYSLSKLKAIFNALRVIQVVGTDIFGYDLEATTAKQELPYALLQKAMGFISISTGKSLISANKSESAQNQVEEVNLAKEMVQIAVHFGLNLQDKSATNEFAIFSQNSSSPTNAISKYLHTSIDSSSYNLLTILLGTEGGKVVSHFADILIEAFCDSQSSLSLFAHENLSSLLSNLLNRNIQALFDKLLVALSSKICQDNTQQRENIIRVAHHIFDQIDSNNLILNLQPHTVVLILTLESQCSLFATHATKYMITLSQACIDTFKNATKVDVSEIQSRLEWLPYLIPGITTSCPRPMAKSTIDKKRLDDIGESIEEMIACKFPLDSNQLSPSSDQGREYLAILKSFLQAFERTGCSFLLTPLLPSFREGNQHRYYNYLKETLLRVAENIALPTSQSALEICDICNFSIDVILDTFQDMIVKKVFFHSILLPTVAKLTSRDLLRIFSSSGDGLKLNLTAFGIPSSPNFLKALMDIIAKDINFALMDSHEINTMIFLQVCSFGLLEFIFDQCPLKELKTSFTQLFVGEGSACSGKELTQSLCKVAFKIAKAPITNFSYENLLLELRAAAYRCLAVTVAKTQSEEQFFDTFLFKTKPTEDLWNKVILAGLISRDNVQEKILQTDYEGFETSKFGHAENTSHPVNDILRLRKMAIHARLGAGRGGALTQYMDNSLLSTSSITSSQISSSQSASNNIISAKNDVPPLIWAMGRFGYYALGS